MIYKRTEESEQILKQIYACIDKNDGIAKKEQIVDIGIDYRRVLDYVESGEIIRIKNGYYTYQMDRFSKDALVSKLFPDGVLCMESALYAYGYISKKPEVYHIAIDKNTSKSRFKLEYPKVLPYYTEPEVLKIGVKEIQIENFMFQIYDKDRLICDCLKYENKMDRAVFKEALQAYIKDEEKNIDALVEYAKERKVVQKVQNVVLVWLDDSPVIPKKKNITKPLKNAEEKKKVVVPKKENTFASDLFDIMIELQEISDMGCYHRVNERLKKDVISGLYTYQDLKVIEEEQTNIVTMERLRQFSECIDSESMQKKWKKYAKAHTESEESWEDITHRVKAFISPLWKSLCKDEVFFDEWMPELERFLG